MMHPLVGVEPSHLMAAQTFLVCCQGNQSLQNVLGVMRRDLGLGRMMGAYSSLAEDLCWYPWRQELVQENLEPCIVMITLASIDIDMHK